MSKNQKNESPNDKTEKELKIAFFDASKITEAFKQFDYESIQGVIEFVEN